MSTKKEATSTITYDPASMNAFTSMQPNISNVLNDWMQRPDQIQNLLLQQAYKQISQAGNRLNSNVFANLRTGGWGGGNLPAFLQATLARNSRALSANQANAFLSTLLNTKQLQLQATNMAAGYRPLQTGGKTVETTSGLGTWLPQVISGGLGLATAFAGGGVKGGGGAGGGFGLSPSAAGNLSNMGFNTMSAAPINPFLSDMWKR